MNALIDVTIPTDESPLEQSDGLPMRVIFYGKLASTFGREVEVAVEHPSNIAALRTHLLKAYPDSKLSLENKRVRACVDGTIVSDEHPLDQGDTVEFLAPVSGG